MSTVYYLPGSDSGNSEKDIPLAKGKLLLGGKL